MSALPPPRAVLPVLVFSQFAGTSLWFAGNAVLAELTAELDLVGDAVSVLTSSVQLGFIAGTLLFAILNVADLFSPSRVFLAASIAGASANLLIATFAEGMRDLVVLRFLTGVALAGIYPVGMKIAASWYPGGLGRALGWLVGALVVGTAFPRLLRSFDVALSWKGVIFGTSILAVLGGIALVSFVGDGGHLPRSSRFDPRAAWAAFRSREFRASSFGYFGHMWELYAFWAFVPGLIHARASIDGSASDAATSLTAFCVIGAGGVACVLGGWAVGRWGSARVAALCLIVSASSCLLSPVMLMLAPSGIWIGFLVIWGMAVVGDSPQFSALNASSAPREHVASALTFVVSTGFLITIPAIELTSHALASYGPRYAFLPLAVGPILGILALVPALRSKG
ncbi:MAG TPA: MFS transporter [Planctomycetota bacterium]|nr:MFS transporter [Planctomycetota bacterium]